MADQGSPTPTEHGNIRVLVSVTMYLPKVGIEDTFSLWGISPFHRRCNLCLILFEESLDVSASCLPSSLSKVVLAPSIRSIGPEPAHPEALSRLASKLSGGFLKPHMYKSSSTPLESTNFHHIRSWNCISNNL